QALAKTDRNAVKMPCPLRGWDAGGHYGVPKTRSVKVHQQTVLACPGADCANFLEGKNAPAAAIVRVLQADKARADQASIKRPHLAVELGDIEDAVIALDGATGDAAEHGGAARFKVVNMASRLAQKFVAGLRVRLDAGLVRHRARGQEQGCLLAEHRGNLPLK